MRRQANIYLRCFQLESEDSVVGIFLKRISKRDSGRYWDYECIARIDVHHVMSNCSAWKIERTLMCKDCEKDNSLLPTTNKQLLR